MRVKLTVSYDGTNYHGWQIQPNGITIQQVLNEHLSKLLDEDIEVFGASRTDSGVHSLGNVCAFDTNTTIPAEKISFAINRYLPEDISVIDSARVDDDFHPRFSKSIKTYEYAILNARHRMPTISRYAYHYHHNLDASVMDEAAKHLIGEHDFTSYASIHAQTNSYVRTIYDCSVKREGDVIKIRISGNGFLYNMVRIIAGTLIQVGAGIKKPDEIAHILKEKDRGLAGPTAPAKGLILIGIQYIDI